jgi:hypothetical protein
MERFYCMDCGSFAELTLHLRCATCGSDSVASEATHATYQPKMADFEITELKRIFAL